MIRRGRKETSTKKADRRTCSIADSTLAISEHLVCGSVVLMTNPTRDSYRVQLLQLTTALTAQLTCGGEWFQGFYLVVCQCVFNMTNILPWIISISFLTYEFLCVQINAAISVIWGECNLKQIKISVWATQSGNFISIQNQIMHNKFFAFSLHHSFSSNANHENLPHQIDMGTFSSDIPIDGKGRHYSDKICGIRYIKRPKFTP